MHLDRLPRRSLSAMLNLLPGEAAPVALLFLLSFFLMGITDVFADTTSNALFLAAWGSRGLPYIYLTSAVLIPLAGVVFRGARRRVSLGMLLSVTVALLFITAIGFRVGLLLGDNRWVVALLMIWYRLTFALIGLIFWGVAGQLFTLRQGKRLFGFVSSGETLAKILGYFAVAPLVVLIGTPNLLLLVVMGLGCSLIVLVLLTRQFSALRQPSAAAASNMRRVSSSRLKLNPYVLLLLVVAALAVWIYAMIDVGFATAAHQRYADADHLAVFLGIFSGVINVLRLGARPAASWFFRRYGLLSALLVLPAALLIGVTGVVLAGTVGMAGALFWAMVVTRLLDSVFRKLVHKPAIQLAYQPLEADERLATQVTAETMVDPVTSGVVGLLLLLLTTTRAINLVVLAYGMIVIVIVWIGAAIALSRRYRQTLFEALKRQSLEEAEIAFDDASSVHVIEQALESPHSSAVLFALDLLQREAPEVLRSHLLRLLGNTEPAVRIAALGRIAQLEVRSAVPRVECLIATDPVARVRAAALQTWCCLAGDDVLDQALSYLASSDLQLRHGALVGLLHSGDIACVVAAGQTLLGMVDAVEPAERVCAAEVLADVGVRGFYRTVLRLLEDGDQGVQRTALIAAGRIAHPTMWPPLIAAIGRPALRSSAVAALRGAGVAALPALTRALGDPDQPELTRIELVQICGSIAGTAAIETLKGHLADPGFAVRREVARMLGRCGYQVIGSEATQLHERIRAEVALAVGMLAALVDLGDGAETALVRDALLIELQRMCDHILNLLALCYNRRTMLRTRASLNYGTPTMRAFALETIDLVVARDLRDWIVPLLDDQAPVQRLRRMEHLAPQRLVGRERRLEQLSLVSSGTSSSWMRACCLHAADNLGWVDESRMASDGGDSMRALVERVLILKSVSIFAQTPDDVLASVAALLDEEEWPSGHTVFQKGDVGTSMYIIVTGEVRVHDGEHTLNHLVPPDVFGEMALLDPEPRSASVTTVRPTTFLRLDQELFYEVVDERSEVARGVIQVLCRRLRARLRDLDETRLRLEAIEPHLTVEAAPVG